MQDQVNNGGPAFPRTGSYGRDAQEGMSLRDYFAAKAMAGLILNDADIDFEDATVAVAILSYRLADAMLRARGAQ